MNTDPNLRAGNNLRRVILSMAGLAVTVSCSAGRSEGASAHEQVTINSRPAAEQVTTVIPSLESVVSDATPVIPAEELTTSSVNPIETSTSATSQPEASESSTTLETVTASTEVENQLLNELEPGQPLGEMTITGQFLSSPIVRNLVAKGSGDILSDPFLHQGMTADRSAEVFGYYEPENPELADDNVMIVAVHRTSGEQAFRDIHRVVPGDQIMYSDANGTVSEYRAVHITTVDAEDTSLLNQAYLEPTIILYACSGNAAPEVAAAAQRGEPIDDSYLYENPKNPTRRYYVMYVPVESQQPERVDNIEDLLKPEDNLTQSSIDNISQN